MMIDRALFLLSTLDLIRQLGIAHFVSIEIDYFNFDAVLDLDRPKLVQVRAPTTLLGKVVGDPA